MKMTLPDTRSIAAALVNRLGMGVVANCGNSESGQYVDLVPTDLDESEGFRVRVSIGWRHVVAELLKGSFARDLLLAMGSSTAEQRASFSAHVRLAASRGGAAKMVVNGASVLPEEPALWPENWQTLSLSVERTPLLIDHDDVAALNDLVDFWGGCMFAMAVALLPVDDESTEVLAGQGGLPEGARQQVVVNRYERSRVNRALCIAFKGHLCSICGFDFHSFYGELGADYIHVHHIVPVAQLGANYVIDIEKDLIPVCPNCHAMLHRQNPPLSPEDLRERLGDKGRTDEGGQER